MEKEYKVKVEWWKATESTRTETVTVWARNPEHAAVIVGRTSPMPHGWKVQDASVCEPDTVANAPTVARDEQQAGDVVERLEDGNGCVVEIPRDAISKAHDAGYAFGQKEREQLRSRIRALEEERDKHHRLQVEAEDRATGLCRQLATAREALEEIAKRKCSRPKYANTTCRDWAMPTRDTCNACIATAALKTLSTTEHDSRESEE